MEKNKLFDTNWYCPICGIRRIKGNHVTCSKITQLKNQQGKNVKKGVVALDRELKEEFKKLILEQTITLKCKKQHTV